MVCPPALSGAQSRASGRGSECCAGADDEGSSCVAEVVLDGTAARSLRKASVPGSDCLGARLLCCPGRTAWVLARLCCPGRTAWVLERATWWSSCVAEIALDGTAARSLRKASVPGSDCLGARWPCCPGRMAWVL